MHCEACGTEVRAETRVCSGCAADLAPTCAKCQTALPLGAKFCPGCGQPVAEALEAEHSEGPATPAAEHKVVTILFSDFCEFTSWSEKLDREESRDYVDKLFQKLKRIIVARGGIVEKFIGDAIMAVFGAHQARENDPERAVRAALQMHACLAKYRRASSLPPLEMRIGIQTGLVVAGSLGSERGLVVWGDTVNVANRIEQLAPKGGVLISHDTYRNVQVYGWFDVQQMAPVKVKGKVEPLQTYLVLRRRGRFLGRTLRGVEGITTQMVGRAEELARLQSAFREVLEKRQLRMLTIFGEAGIGKSCLLNEFQKWRQPLPEIVRLFYGRASAELAGLPFALMRDVFYSRFQIQETDSPARARKKFERGMMDLVGSLPEASASSTQKGLQRAHFIGHLLGLDFSASPYLRGLLKDSEQIRHRAFQYLTAFFSTLDANRPSAARDEKIHMGLLIIEDLHWSDEGSLDLIDHLARTCKNAPLMIVCLARPTLLERRPAWGEDLPGHERLRLEALSGPESEALMKAILRNAPEIPSTLRELITSGAEGNPFYIEEFINMLIDQKVIIPLPEKWRIEPERLAAVRVPTTLTGVLQARLDSLKPRERGLLQRASVVGRVFWDSALERLFAAPGLEAGRWRGRGRRFDQTTDS